MRGAGAQRRGQTLIEFALILPLLLLLIMNVVNFGAYLYAGVTVANAARTGTQYIIPGGAWVGGPVPQLPPYSEVINLVTRDANALPNKASLVVKVCTKNEGTTVCTPTGAPTPPVPDDPEGGLYVTAAVDVTYTYEPLIPFWDFPNLGIHLTLPAQTVRRRAVMRMVQ